MSFYDKPENAEQYIEMAKGYDGAELIEILTAHLPKGKAVLELGMGPGVDLDLLAPHYQVTGSDYSAYFVERYKKAHPDADVMELNAVTMDVARQFDGIYSNKVLHHFSDEELRQSFAAQADCLYDEGLIFHSFWHGDHMEEMMGMRFYYRRPDTLTALLGDQFKLVDSALYTEMEKDDSFWILAQKS
ncbi:class I SAM-dependent methyltransferase [Maritalea mediterranea]|uniref:Class I SAM-dependent methyltransferase n=1 Tax=Maritalea mediterranea TaxID=2909667 RepID=A0ABS9E975_9HYPH|nr:class I SAM-dependent methyltransferase [Maritalea mediterranea]MCF4099392.1 class I SAM-dependent methyltransferase [Maritalea mediterranea]